MVVLPLLSCWDTNLLFFKNHNLLSGAHHLVYGVYMADLCCPVILYYFVVWSPVLMGIDRFWQTAMVNKYSLSLNFLLNLAILLRYLLS